MFSGCFTLWNKSMFKQTTARSWCGCETNGYDIIRRVVYTLFIAIVWVACQGALITANVGWFEQITKQHTPAMRTLLLNSNATAFCLENSLHRHVECKISESGYSVGKTFDRRFRQPLGEQDSLWCLN